MTPSDLLAAYAFPDVERRYKTPTDPRFSRTRLVTDPDGERHPARMPSPVAMAETFARPLVEARFGVVHRLPGGALVTADGERLSPDTLRAIVLDALLTLPARDGLAPHAAYTAVLRVAADETERAYLARYALEVAQACTRRDVFPAPPAAPKPAPAPRQAKTPAQWKADQRARDRAAEVASARAWLEVYLAEDPSPRTVAAPALYELAADAIESFVDDEETHEDGTPWRVPGPRTFYAIADEVLGARTRDRAGVRFYSIPQPTPEETPVSTAHPDDVLADELLERIARLGWEEEREHLRAVLDRRKAATPAPVEASQAGDRDNVTDLGAYRARRRA